MPDATPPPHPPPAPPPDDLGGPGREVDHRLRLAAVALGLLAVTSAAAWGVAHVELGALESVQELDGARPWPFVALGLAGLGLVLVGVLGWWVGRAPTGDPGWEARPRTRRVATIGVATAGLGLAALMAPAALQPTDDDLRDEDAPTPFDGDMIDEPPYRDCCIDAEEVAAAQRAMVAGAGLGVVVVAVGAALVAGAAGTGGAGPVRGGGTRRPG